MPATAAAMHTITAGERPESDAEMHVRHFAELQQADQHA